MSGDYGVPDLERYSHSFTAMASPCAIHLYTDDVRRARAAAEAAEAEVRRIESRYSRFRADSLLSTINAIAWDGGEIVVDDETAALLDFAFAAHAESDGLFDITAGLLLRAWNFTEPRLPTPAELAALLPRIGMNQLDWQRPLLRFLRPGMALDFGGIGKGWALDRAAEVLRARGVSRAFVNFGGQIMALGTAEDGGDWTVVLPGRAEPLRVRDASVSTSGDSERPGHIVSPVDGRPVRRTVSATAVLPRATDADAWSTALYVLGKTPPSFPGRSYFAAAPSRPIKGKAP
ncbi:MAG: FAD:protein FMN transferase [Elusimicrobia bacterium]|nr:FAD:protein FMN transferase [Elusimicrobiota bacterium]